MNFTFDERLTEIERIEYAKRAQRVYLIQKEDTEEKNKILYKMHIIIGFYTGDPSAPFIMAKWGLKNPDSIHIIIFDDRTV